MRIIERFWKLNFRYISNLTCMYEYLLKVILFLFQVTCVLCGKNNVVERKLPINKLCGFVHTYTELDYVFVQTFLIRSCRPLCNNPPY